MFVWEALREAMRLLRAHKARSILTLFGVVWGTAAVIFLVSWGDGVTTMLEWGFSRTGKDMAQVWAGKISEDFTPAVDRRYLWFTTDDVEALRRRARLPALIAGETRTYMAASYRQRGVNVEVRGVEPEGIEIRGVEVAAGRMIGPADLQHRRRVVVLGPTVREWLMGVQGRIGDWVRLDGKPFQVIGFMDRVGTQLNRDGNQIDEQLWVPLSTFHAHWPEWWTEDAVVKNLIYRLRDRDLLDATENEVRAILAERLGVPASDKEALQIWSSLKMLRRLPLEEQKGLMFIISATTLLIGGIGILSMMLDSVRERRPEIGVRLAVGARRRDILLQFFLETFLIVSAGGVLGVALGVGGTLWLGSLELPDLIPVPVLSRPTIVLALVVMGLVGVFAGMAPAWRASRTDPSSSLREE